MEYIFHFGVTNTKIWTHTHKIQNVKCNLHIFFIKKYLLVWTLNKKKSHKKNPKNKKLQYIRLFPPCLLRWMCSSGSLEFHFPTGNWARTKPATWQTLGRWWDQNWDPQFSGTVLVFKEVPCGTNREPQKGQQRQVWKGGQSEQDILRVEAQVPWEVDQGSWVLGPGQGSLRSRDWYKNPETVVAKV